MYPDEASLRKYVLDPSSREDGVEVWRPWGDADDRRAVRRDSYFETRHDVLDAILAARYVQERAWEAWFAIRDANSSRFEAARLDYVKASAELHRLVGIDNHFRAGPQHANPPRPG